MLDQGTLNKVLVKFAQEMKEIFRGALKQVILFGSYSTGNQAEESDIDIMILVDMDNAEISEYRELVVNIACDLSLEYDAVISPMVQSYSQFQEYKDVLPFFKNVEKGVKIGA